MEFSDVVRRRHMTRSFAPRPIEPAVLDPLLAAALRAPTAGFTQGVDLLVLESPAETGPFFAATCDADFLADPGRYAGLLQAPTVVVPLADPARYVARYAEADKSAGDLAGLEADAWPVPYWLVDASFAAMSLLLAATDAGLGALLFRLHRDPAGYLADLGAPAGLVALGAVALGHEAEGGPGPPGSPARRARRPAAEAVHRGRW